MNIARVIYEWPPPWLGLAPAPYELTKAQQKRGHFVEVFSGRWPNSGDLVTIPGVKNTLVWRAPLPGTVTLTSSILIFFKYLFARKRSSYDLIHAHGHFAIWIYAYRNFLNKYFPWVSEMKIPLVVHFHNTVKGRKEKLIEKGSEIKKVSQYLDWPLAEYADRMAVKVADAMIFVSEDLKQEAIKHYNADPLKCFVVESGVNPSDFKPSTPDEIAKTRIELGFQPHDKVILNLGAFVERKNIHVLVESLKHLPNNYKLLLIGSGEDAYLDKVEEVIQENDLKSRVIKTGYTPYPQVPIAYQAADIFVLPSSFEGLPKAAMESLACGTQVLASGFNINSEISGIEYLEKVEPEFIANKIKQMIQNPQVVDYTKVARDYSWDVKATQIEVIYEHVKENFLK